MLSKELEKSLNEIAQSASARRHEFITVEHLLLALMSNEAALEVLKNVGGDAAASPPTFLSTSNAASLLINANRRCSTVINSCRRALALCAISFSDF